MIYNYIENFIQASLTQSELHTVASYGILMMVQYGCPNIYHFYCCAIICEMLFVRIQCNAYIYNQSSHYVRNGNIRNFGVTADEMCYD